MPCALLQTIVEMAVVAGAVGFVVWQMQPSLILADTTPAGGDTGAHVWAPAYLRDHLLPHGRITGWTPDWFAGFPAFTFYFPLPSLLIVALDVFLPYNVAFKLVTALGPVSLPGAAYALGRLTRLRFPGPALLAVATLLFLFDTSFTIYGGNIASTLAGEFAYSISLSLALVFLGVFARGLEQGRHLVWAAVLLALTGLSHLVPTLFAIGSAVLLTLLFFKRRRLRYLLSVGVVSGLLVGFWALPFIARLRYSTDMGWVNLTNQLGALFPPHLVWIAPLAVVGLAAAIGLRLRSGIAIAAIAAPLAAAFVLLPQGRLWNARLLPFWFLAVYLLAGIGASEVGRSIGGALAGNPDRPLRSAMLATPVAALAIVVVVLGGQLGALPSWAPRSDTGKSFIPGWVRWNYSGYEGKAAYPEYRALIDTMSRLPCGRASWEYAPELDRYGTPMALMLLPYWTHGCIGSVEGLYFESSPTVPFHFLAQSELSERPSRPQSGLPYRGLDVAAGIEHLRLLGVRYYMAFSERALSQARDNTGLRLVASSGPWEVFEVAGSEQVTPLENRPAVVAGIGGRKRWLKTAIGSFQDPSRWDVALAADGPPEWSRVAAGAKPARTSVRPARVSRIRTGDLWISFQVDRPGSPVLVKTSYFPNWKVSGARGQWRVTPNLMVVNPTRRDVELRYGYTGADVAGWALTLVGLAVAVGIAVRSTKR